MAIKPDYEAGTVSITNGTTRLIGINTFWALAKIQKGDTFKVKNLDAIIEEVVSDTEITLKEVWTGGDLAASAYAIRYQPDGSRFAGAYVEIRDLLANGNLTAFAGLVGALDLIPIFTGAGALSLIPKNDLIQGIQTNEKVDTLAERAAFDGEAKGFTVLVADVGDGRSAIYFKVSGASGDWSDPAFLTGPSGSFQSKGPYSGATAYVVGDVVLQNGSSWIARADTTGNAPPTLPATSNTQWLLLAAAGSGFVFKGDYSSATTYLKDDVVIDQGSSWIALQSTTGNAPPILPTTSNSYWKALTVKGSGDVSGPASSVIGNIPMFTDTTGKVIGDSGVPAKTASIQNLLVNPIMQVSNENGSAAVTTAANYPVDQWRGDWVTNVGAISHQRVESKTPRGSRYRLRMTVTTADTSIAAGEYLYFFQALEGVRLASLGWNGTTGIPLVLRFGFRGPAGTYSVSYRNAAVTKAYVSNFTITALQANTDVEIIKTIPADTTGGAWTSVASVAAYFTITLAAGSTYTATPDTWQNGNLLGGTGISNGFNTTGNVFELFDCGLYADPYSTGIPPIWIPPTFNNDNLECMRYWQYVDMWMAGYVAGAMSVGIRQNLPVPMRTSPAVEVLSVGNVGVTGSTITMDGTNVIARLTATGATTGGYITNVTAKLNARM